jgi:hypothetical protein
VSYGASFGLASFTARSKEELRGEQPPALIVPGTKAPEADREGLRSLGADEFYPRKWQYIHPTHTLDDFMRLGYFANHSIRSTLKLGDEIHYTLCGGHSKDPEKWQRGICVVMEIPNNRTDPLILGGLHKYSHPTPWWVEKGKAA